MKTSNNLILGLAEIYLLEKWLHLLPKYVQVNFKMA